MLASNKKCNALEGYDVDFPMTRGSVVIIEGRVARASMGSAEGVVEAVGCQEDGRKSLTEA